VLFSFLILCSFTIFRIGPIQMNRVVRRVRWIASGESSLSAVAQTFLVRGFIISLNIATGIITARALGAQGRGEQAAILMWGQFIAYASTLGLSSSLTFHIKKDPETASDLMGSAMLAGLVLSFVGVGVGVNGIPYWLKQYPSGIIETAQIVLLTVPFALVSGIASAGLQARGEFSKINKISYLLPISTLSILSWLVIRGECNSYTSVLAYVLPGVTINSFTIFLAIKKIGLKFSSIPRNLKALLSYGIRAYGIDVFSILGAQIDQILAVALLSPSMMGTYAVSLNLSRLIDIFQNSVNAVLFPKVAASSADEIAKSVGLSARVCVLLTGVSGIAIMTATPYILNIAYGQEFVSATQITRLLTVHVILSTTTWVLSQAFMASGNPGIVTILQGLGLGITSALMVFAVPRMGLSGVGWSLIASSAGRLIYILACFKFILKVKVPSLIFSVDDYRLIQRKLKLS
jgi:O-antigen/teichoic acid export membrane protein